MASGEIAYHSKKAERWRVTLVDTGEDTMTGGRLKRIAAHVQDSFFMTYGDGVADVDIRRLRIFIANMDARQQSPASCRRDATERFHSPARTRSRALSRSQLATMHALMAAFLFLTARCLIASKGASPPLRESRLPVWLGTASSWPSPTTAFGCLWTRSATRTTLKICGKEERRPGRCGSDKSARSGLLEG